jgi:hypothetical protein
MMLDKFCQLSAAQALTADAISTNVLDLGPTTNNLTRDLGAGTPLFLTVLVTTVLDSAGEGATMVVTLESDDNTSLSSATTHITLASVAEATLAAGYFIAQAMPLPHGAYQRYVGVRYNVSTEDFTSGNISAWIHYAGFDVATVAYASGFTSGY